MGVYVSADQHTKLQEQELDSNIHDMKPREYWGKMSLSSKVISKSIVLKLISLL